MHDLALEVSHAPGDVALAGSDLPYVHRITRKKVQPLMAVLGS